ncbi:hypothetical protein [Herbaspirillum sp. LeCh32-8]|uniref:hypothetical protein n=1 Tax=Herbaspirillum sp. LeCh32-8 TaxID=2821356 RepID=UPI0032AF3206
MATALGGVAADAVFTAAVLAAAVLSTAFTALAVVAVALTASGLAADALGGLAVAVDFTAVAVFVLLVLFADAAGVFAGFFIAFAIESTAN